MDALASAPMAVVACTLGGVRAHFVVWRGLADERCVALPLSQHQTGHRAEVPVGVLAGLPGSGWLIRVGSPREVRPAVRVGTVPPALWSAINAAVRREQAVRRTEDAANDNRSPRRQSDNRPQNLWKS